MYNYVMYITYRDIVVYRKSHIFVMRTIKDQVKQNLS